MQVYVERGVSKGDCLHKIVNKYGIRFTILREKPCRLPGIMGFFSREGVELEFCIPIQRDPWQSAAISAQGGAGDHQPSAEQLLLQYPPGRQSTALSPALLKDDSTLNFVEEKRRVLAAAGKDPDRLFREMQEEEAKESELQARNQQLILEKLNELQEKIDTKSAAKPDHPSLLHIAQLLRLNDFSEWYTAGILEKARKELPLEILEDFNAIQNRVLGWIGESIKIFETPGKPEFGPGGRILVLIGPTGVGKTTTIVKLAAINSVENSGRPPLSVRMITIDGFKIGASEQIEKYSNIMEIPFAYIDNRRDLRREIDLYREETDLILVDTIGRSPRDSAKLGEMKELIDACGSRAEIHLVLAASTKTSDMEHILQQFEPFDYQAVILTKLDETRHIGNLISALAERGKPVSYITDGQLVPKDIKKANIVQFLINLDEFRVDREEIEKRFPASQEDQFQWG